MYTYDARMFVAASEAGLCTCAPAAEGPTAKDARIDSPVEAADEQDSRARPK
jgi:hypothetical protein